ncbi:MAG TPA: hypothetical protein VKE96_20860, partial [Vicinamibacterales bacterium]|nr:hypothetical protein [Vicinamibacterales bacterium]
MTITVRLKADTTAVTIGTGSVRLQPDRDRRLQPDRRVLIAAVLLAAFTLIPVLQPSVDAQLPTAADDRYAGLQWRFVRIRYHYTTEGTHVAQDFYGEPWYIDAPAAE